MVTETNFGSCPDGPCAAWTALGSSTLLPRWSMGVITMKIIKSTSTTSTSGVMLMSDLTAARLLPTSMLIAVSYALGAGGGTAAGLAPAPGW